MSEELIAEDVCTRDYDYRITEDERDTLLEANLEEMHRIAGKIAAKYCSLSEARKYIGELSQISLRTTELEHLPVINIDDSDYRRKHENKI